MNDLPVFGDPPDTATWHRADLHLHTEEDLLDAVDYDASTLLTMAQERNIRMLAITLHRVLFWKEELAKRAAGMGILLIPGTELRIEGADVVLLNARPGDPEKIRTFDDLRTLRKERGKEILTLLPHPFYVIGGSIGRRAWQLTDCFDAIEYCHFHSTFLNPNRAAVQMARKHGKPMLATSDSHRRIAFGRHYTWIEAGPVPTIESVFQAIRENRVRLVSPACSVADFLSIIHFILIGHPARKRRMKRFGMRPKA
jgi:predicted metal-dependent phosphoesterase TrpH